MLNMNIPKKELILKTVKFLIRKEVLLFAVQLLMARGGSYRKVVKTIMKEELVLVGIRYLLKRFNK